MYPPMCHFLRKIFISQNFLHQPQQGRMYIEYVSSQKARRRPVIGCGLHKRDRQPKAAAEEREASSQLVRLALPNTPLWSHKEKAGIWTRHETNSGAFRSCRQTRESSTQSQGVTHRYNVGVAQRVTSASPFSFPSASNLILLQSQQDQRWYCRPTFVLVELRFVSLPAHTLII